MSSLERGSDIIPNSVEVEELANIILGDSVEGDNSPSDVQYFLRGISEGVSILTPPERRIKKLPTEFTEEFRWDILQLLKGGEVVVKNFDDQPEVSEEYKIAARAITRHLSSLESKDYVFFNAILKATDTLVGSSPREKFPSQFLPLFWGGIMAVYMVYYK